MRTSTVPVQALQRWQHQLPVHAAGAHLGAGDDFLRYAGPAEAMPQQHTCHTLLLPRGRASMHCQGRLRPRSSLRLGSWACCRWHLVGRYLARICQLSVHYLASNGPILS